MTDIIQIENLTYIARQLFFLFLGGILFLTLSWLYKLIISNKKQQKPLTTKAIIKGEIGKVGKKIDQHTRILLVLFVFPIIWILISYKEFVVMWFGLSIICGTAFAIILSRSIPNLKTEKMQQEITEIKQDINEIKDTLDKLLCSINKAIDKNDNRPNM